VRTVLQEKDEYESFGGARGDILFLLGTDGGQLVGKIRGGKKKGLKKFGPGEGHTIEGRFFDDLTGGRSRLAPVNETRTLCMR